MLNGTGELSPNWRGDNVAYAAVHARLARQIGKAADFDCSSCGGVAQEWAYQHGAPDERVCDKAGLPYSTDLSYYKPMCGTCHRELDTFHGWSRPRHFGRGVTYVARVNRWRAYASVAGKQHSAGYHATRDEAATAADRLRAELLTNRTSPTGPAAAL